MKLYKFRSLENFEFIADILINKKLYASKFDKLNDPMEGYYDNYQSSNSLIEKVNDEINNIYITSLSRRNDNPILWAHYANEFKGICIEIETHTSTQFTVHNINYTKTKRIIGNSLFDNYYTANDYAKQLLTTKFPEWKYESETRLLTNNNFIIEDFNINAIYLGVKTSSINKEVIRRLCPEIPIFNTKIDEHNKIKVIKNT